MNRQADQTAYDAIVFRLKNLPREDLEFLALSCLVEWWDGRGGGDKREEAAVRHFYDHAQRDHLPKMQEIANRFDQEQARRG